MNRRALFCFLIAGMITLPFSGCKSGKLAMPQMPKVSMPSLEMPKLAMPDVRFWKKDSDTLSDDYIEPPSRQFSPDSSISKNGTATEQGNSDRLSDQLASRSTTKDRPYSMNMDPSADAAGTSSGTSSRSLENFKSDLESAYGKLAASPQSPPQTPVAKSSDANVDRNSPFGGTSYASSPQATPNTQSSLQPRFSGNASNTQSAPVPSYERLAQLDAQAKAQRSVESPLTPSLGTSDSQSIKNPYINQADAALSGDAEKNSAQTVSYEQYPSTPYKPYQPRDTAASDNEVIDAPSAVGSQVAEPAPAPSSSSVPGILLRGQGSYAPGSINALESVKPDEVVVPQSFDSGGEFQPN